MHASEYACMGRPCCFVNYLRVAKHSKRDRVVVKCRLETKIRFPHKMIARETRVFIYFFFTFLLLLFHDRHRVKLIYDVE